MVIRPLKRRWRLTLGGVAFCAALLWSAPAGAQWDRDRDDERWDEPRPVAPTHPQDVRDGADGFDDESHRRIGLFREGSHLLGVRATFRRDGEFGGWVATLTLEAATGQPEQRRDMRLLPNSFLAEAQRVIDLTPDQNITFEITGETFIYEGRNYLLLRSPARVIALETADEKDEARQDQREERDENGRARSAADVMRDLERATGPLHRASPAPRPAEAAIERRQFREGSLLIARRGRVTRDAGGAWMFVFEADAQGLADPPLTLMPCLLLERIERYARAAGPTAPILISGQVFVHENRGYLLPSAFQVPREMTPMN